MSATPGRSGAQCGEGWTYPIGSTTKSSDMTSSSANGDSSMRERLGVTFFGAACKEGKVIELAK